MLSDVSVLSVIVLSAVTRIVCIGFFYVSGDKMYVVCATPVSTLSQLDLMQALPR